MLQSIDLKATPVFYENLEAYKKGIYGVIVNEGSSRSSKSYSLMQLMIYIALTEPGKRISVVSHSLPHIKRGVYRDFMVIMMDWNIFNDNNWRATDFVYTFSNGSIIELFGLEDETKARGPGRDILWCNECNLIKLNLYQQLAMRTTGQIFGDLNPSDFVCYWYTIADDPANLKIHSTYKQNLPNLSQRQIEMLESYKDLPDDFMYKVFTLGLRGAAKEIIYTQWKYGELPGKGDVFYGLDFGFNHPAALVKVEHYEGTNYVQECIYQSNLTLADLIQKIKEYVKDRSPIYADAAEPKSIEEIYRAGINIKAASKDVWAGILKVKSYPLVIDSRSKNIQKELSSYKWKKDKNDNIIEEPVKANDDACDAMRYAIYSHFDKPTFKIAVG